MRPTLFGTRALLLYAVILGAYFAAPYVNLFFLLLAFLTLHWLLAAVWTWRSVSGVTATFGASEPIPAGTAAGVPVTLEVPRGQRFDVNASLELAREPGLRGKPQRLSGQAHVARGTVRIEARTEGLSRGIYPVRRAYLSSTYPFGLLQREVRVPGPAEVVVYPPPAATSTSARSAEDLVRELLGTSPTGGGDLQPSSLRDFVPGDSQRAVHWRASARRGKLVVQEWEGGGGDGLEVVLDRRCSPEELEGALCEVSAIVQLAREGKEVLSIRSQDFVDTFGDGHQPWSAAVRFLAGADPLPESGPAPPATSPRTLRLPRREARV